MVTCERWLWAPRSEIFLEQGHRLVTGTITFTHMLRVLAFHALA